MQWVPAEKDESLPLRTDIPVTCTNDVLPWAGFCRVDGKGYYYCRFCKGWVEGEPNEYKVNTLGLLSGRQGTEYCCRRCGNEIDFVGCVA